MTPRQPMSSDGERLHKYGWITSPSGNYFGICKIGELIDSPINLFGAIEII
jgi:hypothetical protein